MPTTADYLNALIRDRNSYQQELNNLLGTNVTNLTFTELNQELDNGIKQRKYSSLGNISFKYFPGESLQDDLTRLNEYNFINISNIFFCCNNLKNIDFKDINMSNVTNMSNAFYLCKNLTNANVSNWNTANVTNMSGMFYDCVNLTNVNLSNWNVSNVTNISQMFYYCNNLSNNSLKSIANMCINAVNVTYKNLSNTNTYSPLYKTNKQMNTATIGSDLLSNLTNIGWTY